MNFVAEQIFVTVYFVWCKLLFEAIGLNPFLGCPVAEVCSNKCQQSHCIMFRFPCVYYISALYRQLSFVMSSHTLVISLENITHMPDIIQSIKNLSLLKHNLLSSTTCWMMGAGLGKGRSRWSSSNIVGQESLALLHLKCLL